MYKCSRLRKKINFSHLFKVFRWQVIVSWLFTLIRSLIFYLVFVVLIILLNTNTNHDFIKSKNFTSLLPGSSWKKILGESTFWNKRQFVLFGLSLALAQCLFYYLEELWRKKLKTKGEYYVKNRLLEKFRQLPFEEKKRLSRRTSTLIEIDSVKIGQNWNDLYNVTFGRLVIIIIALVHNWEGLNNLTDATKFFSVFWIFLIGTVFAFLIRLTLRKEEKYKQELAKENNLISKEVNNSILIDSMGLSSEYAIKQKNLTKKNQKFSLSLDYAKSLKGVVSQGALIYPFLSLVLIGGEIGPVSFAFWQIFETTTHIITCLLNYSDYSSSLTRVNQFLSLPEKDDHLQGVKIENSHIKWIELKNIYFRYQGEEKWVLENCQAAFTTQKVNKLSGDNGTGKSTILYLLLGILTPNQGRVLIHMKNDKVYDLHQDANLQHWRTFNTVYLSHDNLLEEGSTGQKQINNINANLTLKKEAKIIVFDEATNSLDQESQEWVEEKIKRLLAANKIVIFVEHFK